MAKAFKWLLPGAVKKTTTKKTTKSNRTLERNKKVQQRSDIQPFLLFNQTHTQHIYARLSCRLSLNRELGYLHMATYFTCNAKCSLTKAK